MFISCAGTSTAQIAPAAGSPKQNPRSHASGSQACALRASACFCVLLRAAGCCRASAGSYESGRRRGEGSGEDFEFDAPALRPCCPVLAALPLRPALITYAALPCPASRERGEQIMCVRSSRDRGFSREHGCRSASQRRAGHWHSRPLFAPVWQLSGLCTRTPGPSETPGMLGKGIAGMFPPQQVGACRCASEIAGSS